MWKSACWLNTSYVFQVENTSQQKSKQMFDGMKKWHCSLNEMGFYFV